MELKIFLVDYFKAETNMDPPYLSVAPIAPASPPQQSGGTNGRAEEEEEEEEEEEATTAVTPSIPTAEQRREYRPSTGKEETWLELLATKRGGGGKWLQHTELPSTNQKDYVAARAYSGQIKCLNIFLK